MACFRSSRWKFNIRITPRCNPRWTYHRVYNAFIRLINSEKKYSISKFSDKHGIDWSTNCTIYSLVAGILYSIHRPSRGILYILHSRYSLLVVPVFPFTEFGNPWCKSGLMELFPVGWSIINARFVTFINYIYANCW